MLAAGRGRRMGALTDERPKPLLEVGGRPILFHQLDALAEAGIRRVAVVVGYLGERIAEAVAAAQGRGEGRSEFLSDVRSDGALDEWPAVSIELPRQESPLGTAHALAAAEPALEDAPFLLLLGDLVVPASVLRRLIDAFEPGVDAVLGIDRQTDPSVGAAVDVESGDDGTLRVRAIVEKPPAGSHPGSWNNTGLYVLPRRAIALARAVRPSVRGEHELPDVVLALLAEGSVVRALEIEEPLRHLGTARDLVGPQD
ncbi:MAG TPA: nucleotidyltransferase family protein [Thermoanaerobaculia bacterium]|nr:nucleotidyltransferase family protein [Thermoanaerobaculia bacterium]